MRTLTSEAAAESAFEILEPEGGDYCFSGKSIVLEVDERCEQLVQEHSQDLATELPGIHILKLVIKRSGSWLMISLRGTKRDLRNMVQCFRF